MRLDTKKLLKIQAENGLSQIDIAASYGCSTQRISVILNATDVRPLTAYKLATALGVEIDDITK